MSISLRKLVPLMAFACAVTTAHAVSINAVYFGQSHVLKPDNPYFGLVGNREALIKVHVTDPAAPASPAVTATLNLNGQSLVVPLTGPATLPVSIPDGLGVVQHSYANSFTAILPAAWVKKGLQVTVNAGAATTTVTDMKVGAPTKIIMTMTDVQYFGNTSGNYPSATFAELEAKWPVADLEVRRLGNVVFPELVIPPREDVGSKSARIKSKAEYQVQTGLTFDGEQAAALEWNGALKRAAGRSGGWSLYYLNVYNAFAGGQAGGFAGVGSGTDVGILHHELGHALNLPHWGDNGAYPYKGDMHGIQAPSNYNETHAGPAWAFHLPTRAFIPPTVQAGNVGGRPVGTYKVDPMQGGGEGWQEPAYLMNHFSDYSVTQMRTYLHGHVVVWNQALNSYAKWNQTAGDYTSTVTNNGVQYPTTRDASVISIMASMSGANPSVNMVYPPIGPYTAGLIRLFDPTVAADRTAAQSIFSPTNGSDYCVRVVQGGVQKTYILAASALTSLAQTDDASLETEAINLPASGGAVTKIELLSTPNVEDVGLPVNPTVLYTWAPLMPEPAAFDLPPTANSSSAITMTALPGEVAFGFSGTVEYLFTETSGNPGATTSAWQTSRSYTDTGLQEGTAYTYTVSIRAGTLATNASAPVSATTTAASTVGNIAVNATQQFSLQSGSGYKTVTSLGTFNPAGTDKLVVVVASENANNDHFALTGVRYNGAQMIEVVQQTGITADGAVGIYYLDNPGAVGSGISVSGYNPNGGLGTAFALNGTRSGFGAFNSRKGNAVTSVPLTTSANKSLVIAALANSGNGNSAGTPTATSPLTQASSGNWGSQWGSHSSGYLQVATPSAVTPTFSTSNGGSYSLNIAALELIAAVIPANTWVQTAGGAQSWTTAVNWADGIVPNPTSGVTMDFSSVDILANTVLNLGANRSASVWKFGDSTGAQTWTVSSGNTLTLAGTTPGIDVQSGIVTQLDCDVAGSSGLAKTSAGRLVLAGNNTYTGGTTISSGTLQIGNDGATGNLGTGNITNNAALRFDRTGSLDVPNNISGTGSLTIDCPVGAGTISLGGSNSFTGAVTINSGTLRITNSNALGTGTKSVKINTGAAGNPQLRLDGTSGSIVVPSTISYLTSNESNGAIVNEAGNNTISGPITLTGGGGGTEIYVNAGTLTLSGPINANTSGRALKLMGAGNGSVTGIVSNSSASTSMGVTKEGAGTWTLSGNNTHGGGTNVVAGTLVISHPNALGLGSFGSGNGGTSITAGAALNLNGVQNINEVITMRGTGISNGGALTNSSASPASIASGVVNISLTAGGVHSTVPTITFSGGGGTGAAATATLGLTAASFTITGGTTVYSVAPTVTISGGGGSGAAATAILTGGVVSGITITNDGSGFTTAPTIAFSGGTVTTAGTNPTGTGNATKFAVAEILLTANGSGYTSTPNMVFNSGTGTSATATLASVILGADSSIGGSGNITIHPAITGAFSLTKTGAGTVTFQTANTYTGSTTVSAGTLALGASNVLPATAISLDAATLQAANFTDTVGTLDLTGSAIINFGSGAALSFADSNAIDWTGGTLTLTGAFVSGSSLRFGSNASALTPTQLAKISRSGVFSFALNPSGYLITSTAATYASWQATNGSTTAFNADHDQDGVPNGIEFFLGGSSNTTGFTALPPIVNTAGTLSITWAKSSSYAGVYGTDYLVETSETIAGAWTLETVGANLSIIGNNVKYTFPSPLGPKKFARLRVTGP